MLEIARFLRLPESAVFGVSTFYAQFKFVPVGRHMVRLCRGTACHVRGAPRILDEVEKQLSIKPGETVSIPFFIAWYFPIFVHWRKPEGQPAATWRNYYASLWTDSWDVAAYTAKNLPRVNRETESLSRT